MIQKHAIRMFFFNRLRADALRYRLNGLRLSHPGIFVADRGGEEFEEVFAGFVARGGDGRRCSMISVRGSFTNGCTGGCRGIPNRSKHTGDLRIGQWIYVP
jgi:hypothetical protein